MAVNPQEFLRLRLTINVVEMFEQSVGRQTGAQCRGNVILGPGDDINEWLPK